MNDLEPIIRKIYVIRGLRVMLDSDLADLYGVTTGNLNKAVKRNIRRFPPDFMFQLTKEEWDSLRFQIGIIETGRGKYTKYLPHAFTEQGLAMLSGILNSDIAIDVNISIMRAFVAIHRMVASLPKPDVVSDVAQLRRDFEELKLDIEDILHDQNDFNEETRAQLDAFSDALTQLQGQNPTSALPEIGYVAVQKQREKTQNYPPRLTNLNNPLTFRTNHIALLHTASRRMGRAFYCPLLIAFTLFLGSCESYEDPQNEVLRGYFEESKGLFLQNSDSISRFSYKVNEYISRTPAAKNDPFYAKIAENLQKLSLKITINDEWKGEKIINF